MEVSVIVPVYNAEQRIESSLESILNQTFQDFEIILVNDGSTDGSAYICDHYSQIEPKVKVIHQKNLGPSAARNSGIKQACGRYITFLDAGDTVDNNWLSMIIDMEKQYQADLVITGYKELIYKGEKLSKSMVKTPSFAHFKSSGDIMNNIEWLVEEGLINPLWNKLYITEIIKTNKFFLNIKYSLGEDFLFNIDYIEKCNKIVITSESPYNYIVDNEGLTHRYRDNKFYDLKAVTLQYRHFLIRHNKLQDTYYFRLLRNCYSSFMQLFHRNSHMKIREMINYTQKIVHDQEVLEMMVSFRPSSIYRKFIFGILKSKNPYLILLFSKIFHFKKFIIDKR